MTVLPKFIHRGGDMILAHPYAMTGVRSFVFLLDARLDALETLVDAQLNAVSAASGVVYRPFAPLCALVAADIPRMTSADPVDAAKGWISEKDLAFWVPVLAGRLDDAGDFVAERFAWYIPYVWVDEAPAMATGREVYGFPKEAGAIEISKPNQPFRIAAEVQVIPAYGPNSQVVRRTVAEVSPSTAGPLGRLVIQAHGFGELLESIWTTVVAALAGGAVPPPSLALVRKVLDDALHGLVPMVFLKQVADVEDPSRACYQAVVEANARMTAFHGAGGIPGAYSVHVANFDSHPVVNDLGLHSTDPLVLADAWLEYDFVMESGKTIAKLQ